jgi:hypothetical protein
MKLNIHGLGKGEGIFAFLQKKELFFHPSREWITGLFLSTFCLIGGLFFIALDFYTQFYGVADSVKVEMNVMEYRAKDVHTYAEKYNTREEIFNTLRNDRVQGGVSVSQIPVEVPVDQNEISTTTESVISETLADDAVGQ